MRILRKDRNLNKMRHEFIHTNHHGALKKSISLEITTFIFQKKWWNCVVSRCISWGFQLHFLTNFFPQKIPFCPTQSAKLKISGFPGFNHPLCPTRYGYGWLRDNGYETTKMCWEETDSKSWCFLTGNNWLVVFHQPLWKICERQNGNLFPK